MDLIIGERFDLKTYGKKASIHLLINQGEGKFIEESVSDFNKIGMITDLAVSDINQDGWLDIVACGEWMPISVFINSKGSFSNKTDRYGLAKTNGLWNTLLVKDLNGDNIPEIVAGNLGKNTFFNAGMKIYINDFDNNGTEEQIICQYINQNYYPIVDKDELISQLPYLKKKIVKYENYADARIKDLFTATQLEESQVSELNMLESTIFIRNIKGEYEGHNLPEEIQYAPVYAFAHHEEEIKASKGTFYLGGNQYLVKPQFGRYDASMGWSLNYNIIKDQIQFDVPKMLGINGQIRQLEIVNLESKTQLFIGINNQKAVVLQIDTNKKKNE